MMYFLKVFFLVFTFGMSIIFSAIKQLEASNEIYAPSGKSYCPTDRIDIGFVLLPDPLQVSSLLSYRDMVLERLSGISPKKEESTRKPINVPVEMPHISLGHYALLAEELPMLREIINKVAFEFSALTEPMSEVLHATEYNLSFECKNLREAVNPVIVDLYLNLRDKFFNEIVTKQPTIRGLHLKYVCKDKPTEFELLEKYYQNWNTPEYNRICPHFTLVYSHVGRENIISTLSKIKTPPSLSEIRLTHLGLIAIDLNGNPLPDGLIHAVPLKQ